MKVILTGSTGFIGGEVLNKCLAHREITSVLVLSRRDLPHLHSNPKAKVVLLHDFNHYPEHVLNELEGSDAGIWSLGTMENNHAVDIEYPRALFDALSSTPSYASRKRPFRHIHLSGAVVETDQTKSLWFLSEVRKAKGIVQTKVTEYSDDLKSQGKWSTYIVRPGYVFPATANCTWSQSILGILMTSYYSVRNDELAATMVDLAVNGGTKPILENPQIGSFGRKLLAQRSS